MTITQIDWQTATAKDLEKIDAQLRAARERIASAHKEEFLQQVIEAAIDKGIRWSEAASIIASYQPKNDTEAKKLGYKFKGKDKNSNTVYYVRKLKGTEQLT